MTKEDLKLSNSQAFQDMLVYYLLNKKDGYYLEIGCHEPKYINNTYFLDKLGWQGLCLDIADYHQVYKDQRTAKFIQTDLTQTNINAILQENNAPKLIDYISFDVDAATFRVLNDFDFNTYRFKVMTFEHDSYGNLNNENRSLSRKILTDLGYDMICSDISHDYFPYEDWWVDPKQVDKVKCDLIRCADKEYTHVKDIITKLLE